MDDEMRKIGMLIAAFDDERQHLKGAIGALNQTGAQLQREVKGAAKDAVEEALKALHPEIHKAAQALIDIQRLSLWRAAGQHAMVAVVAMAIALLAVWWYVPPISEITARRAERDQLEASIADLNKRGAKIALNTCGPKKRLCVMIEETEGVFGDRKRGETYMIAKGY
jgi:uncharacterized protein YukE